MSRSILLLVVFTLATAALSFVLTGCAVWVARRLDLMAHPLERSSHMIPTPRIGGVGICLSLLAALCAIPAVLCLEPPVSPGYHAIHSGLQVAQPWVRAVSGSAMILVVGLGCAVGLMDDLVHLSALKKLVGLVGLACVPLLFGVVINRVYYPDLSTGPAVTRIVLPVAMLITFMWVLFFANAFNFMDGVNGQAAVFALNAVFWWVAYLVIRPGFAYASAHSRLDAGLPLLAVGGAVLGFLPHNLPKARTFMGDSGSLPIGAVLAVLALNAGGKSLEAFIAFCFPLSLFVYDVLYTLIRRIGRRENLFEAHRSHLYQRLLIATGWSHGRLLRFHLPFYFLSGLTGLAFYRTFIKETYVLGSGETAGFVLVSPVLLPLFGVLILILVSYTFLVLRYEKIARKRTGS